MIEDRRVIKKMKRVTTGIEGLDRMLEGGFPHNHIVVIMGACGTGKTTFGLQYLYKGLTEGEKCIFVTLEESKESILKTGELFNWDFKYYIERQMLGIYKLEPEDAKRTVNVARSELPSYLKQFGAKRVVIDTVSLLASLFNTDTERRECLFKLCNMIKSAGTTAIFTSEVRAENPVISREGLIEYTADGVILLQSREEHDGNVRLLLRILKMRHTNHIRSVKPYEITQRGIVVHAEAELF